MATRAGLIGTFQPPMNRTDISSVYMISDDSAQILFVFILYPGAYMDAYEIASLEKYPNIFIVPVSLDALYVSDVVRLANDLIPYKNCVKIIFPGKAPSYMPVNVQKAMIRTGHSTYSQYTYGFIALNYKIGNTTYQPNFYDIYFTFKRRRVLICPFEVDKERLLTFLEKGIVDWIYVPYSNPMFGADSFVSLLIDERFEPYMNKIVAMGFRDQTHANYCRLRYPDNYPRTMRRLFLGGDSDMVLDTGDPIVVGGLPTATDDDNPDKDVPEILPPPPRPEEPFPKPMPPEKPEKVDMPDTNGEIKIG